MLQDLQSLLKPLMNFAHFTGRTVISVGAGGGQLIEYARSAKQVVAIDSDRLALVRLKTRCLELQLRTKFTYLHTDFYQTRVAGDMLLFEFSLHELTDPQRALQQALQMAPLVVIADHAPDSPWAIVAGEQEQVTRSWQAVNELPLSKTQRFTVMQYFADYDELYEKMKGQGDAALKAILPYSGQKSITIPMVVQLAQLGA